MPRIHEHVHIEWRGGTCRVKWWTGEYLPNGRKRYESKGGFTSEDDAFIHGRDKMYEVRHGLNVTNRDGSTLMSDWLDDWLEAMDHSPTSQKTYRSRVENHIRPYFAHRTVADIDVLAYRTFRKHVYRVCKPNTAKNVMMLFGMIMNDAVPRLIKVSPVERNRRRGKHEKKPRERKRDVSLEVIEQLARNARTFLGDSGYAFIWTMAMTGMRPGELYGLTRGYCYPAWPASDPRPDPDEEARYDEDMERYGKGADLLPAIRVERQVQHVDGRLQFLPPKYGSARTLVIPPFLAEMLDALLASHKSDWVFPAIGGGSLGSVDFNYKYWRRIADGAEAHDGPRVQRPEVRAVPAFEGKRLYLIRHAHKAHLDEDGHSRFAVESRMGHEVQGVEGTYSSVTVPMERAIMKTLQERWEGLQDRLTREDL